MSGKRKRLDVVVVEQLEILGRIREMRVRCDEQEAASVLTLRLRGATWREIAEALGQNLSLVYTRHSDRCRPQTPEAYQRRGRRWRGGSRRPRRPATA